MTEHGAAGTSEQWSDSLSAAWERHRDRLFEHSRHTSQWLIDQVDPKPGAVVLDLAAGPGETGFLAADLVGPGGRIISTDVGPGMVEAARRGAAARGLENVECRTMDAQAMDLDDDSVDAIICRFGVMLMPEPERALAEARRVLRPGGRLAYAVWGRPDGNVWLTALAMTLMEHGHQLPGNPFEAGGPFSLADADRNRDLVTGAGFADPVIEELHGVMPFSDLDDYWTLQSEVSGPVALLAASLDDAEVEEIKGSLPAVLAPFTSATGIEIPTLALGVATTAE